MAQSFTGGLPIPLTVVRGGTGVATFVANGVLYGNAAGAILVTAQGPANSVLTANAGAPSFSAAPTIGTSVTTPTLIGGTAAASTLALRSTSGVGTSDAILFQVGNNGATEAMRITSTGRYLFNTTTITTNDFVHLQKGDNQDANGIGIYRSNGTTHTTLFQGSDNNFYIWNHTGGIVIAPNNGITYATIGPGIQVGAPTGGDKGAGTINTAADIFKNNTAYTNPAYVFEHAYTGQIVRFADRIGAPEYATWGFRPLAEVEAFTRANYELPIMALLPSAGLFDRGELMLASVEQSFLYLFDHERRITEQDRRIAKLEGRG